MTTSTYEDIKLPAAALFDDERPWLVGFSGGKDSTMLAALVFDAVLSVPQEKRASQSLLCALTRA
jgi:DNA sulfur modification protein DndC